MTRLTLSQKARTQMIPRALLAPILMIGLLFLVAALMLVWRTAREDKTLQTELPGYLEFAKETKYRLLPGVW